MEEANFVNGEVLGYDVWGKPNSIQKVEIGREAEGGTTVHIYLSYEDQPRSVVFATRQEALEYYAALWKL